MPVLSYVGSALWNTVLILAIGLLPCLVVAFVMQKCSNAIRSRLVSVLGIKGYVYLTAPGVMIHELSHAFFCLIFRHKIIEMKLFSPEADGTLGYVNHSYNPKSFYQRAGNFFIGTGPVWGGIFSLWVVSRLLLPSAMFQQDSISAFFSGIFSFSLWQCWTTWLWLYLVLTISSHIILSRPDLSGAGDGAVVIIILVLLCNLLLGWYSNPGEAFFRHGLPVMLNILSLSLSMILLLGMLACLLSLFIRRRNR